MTPRSPIKDWLRRGAVSAAALGGSGVWLLVPALLPLLLGALAAWLVLTRTGRQALAIARSGLSTLHRRLGAAAVIVVGIAGVVGVLVALLSMAEGFDATLRRSGSDDTAIVLRAGANAELSSGLDRATTTLIAQKPGVLRDAADRPAATREVVVVANLPKRSTGTDANVEVRGVGPGVWQVRPNVRMVAGRPFRPGRRELIVGDGALRQFGGLAPGSTVRLNNQSWRVTGVFHAGDAHDSELWGDAESVAAAYRRSGFQSVTVRLTGPEAFAQFEAALKTDPRLKVDVDTTRDYYNKQSEQLTRTIRTLGTGVAVIMAIGAVFGALNTMYAAVAARAREMATLRALGFSGVPVVAAVMLEAMALALVGGGLGASLAYAAFNGYSVSTLGSNFSQVVFQFRVSPDLVLRGLQWSLAMGFLGGLFPALRAASIPVTAALREQ